jgi:hypothetical protein
MFASTHNSVHQNTEKEERLDKEEKAHNNIEKIRKEEQE